MFNAVNLYEYFVLAETR